MNGNAVKEHGPESLEMDVSTLWYDLPKQDFDKGQLIQHRSHMPRRETNNAEPCLYWVNLGYEYMLMIIIIMSLFDLFSPTLTLSFDSDSHCRVLISRCTFSGEKDFF